MEAREPAEDSAEARQGQLLHHYWLDPKLDRSFLSPVERDLLNLADELLLEVNNRLGFELPGEVLIEEMLGPLDHNFNFSGTPDRVYLWRNRRSALVADLKTGFAIVESAELNLQLRGYALLVAETFNWLDHVYVAILQPRLWSPSERITMAHYERGDITQARDQIYEIIAYGSAPDAELIPGEKQCRYCRAKIMCPAFRSAVTLPTGVFKTDDELSKAAREAQIEQRIKQCSDEQLEALLEACKLAYFIDSPAKDEARARIESGRFTNFILGKSSSVRKISDVRKAIALLALSKVASREELLDLCEMSVGPIEEFYRRKSNATWKDARDKIDRVLSSVIANEPRKPRILRK